PNPIMPTKRKFFWSPLLQVFGVEQTVFCIRRLHVQTGRLVKFSIGKKHPVKMRINVISASSHKRRIKRTVITFLVGFFKILISTISLWTLIPQLLPAMAHKMEPRKGIIRRKREETASIPL